MDIRGFLGNPRNGSLFAGGLLVCLLGICGGCEPGYRRPEGVTARDWTNDVVVGRWGKVAQVQATWTLENDLLFRGARYTPDAFRDMLAAEELGTNTSIRVAVEPGASVPPGVWQSFWDDGYANTAFLTPDPNHWLKDRP